jgi:xylulokinase
MWLGLDLGTSGVKALLLNDGGAVVARGEAPLSVSTPRPGWSEQDPADWWTAARAAVLALPADLRAAVRGVGLSGQMHGAVLLDAADRVLRPAILWNDGRSAAECAALEAAVPDARAITGNKAMPGFTAPKLLWIRAHEPDVFARVARVQLPKDWLRLVLTGEAASDMSDASGTHWLDVGARAWSPAMLAACELTEAHMPRLLEGNAPSGTLRAEVAAELGLPPVPVAAGGGDNAASAVGLGVVAPGDALLSLGTSGVIFAVSDGFRPAPEDAVHAYAHALPGAWHQMAVTLSAASALDWAARAGGFADVGAAIAAAESERDPPLFLPYLTGERTPHDDSHARGAWFGLEPRHGPAALVAGAMEGVAFALADGADVLRAAGTPIDALTVTGGGARSAAWGRMLADAIGARLDYVDGHDGAALGAARLARMAVTGASNADACPKPAVLRSIAPDAEGAARAGERRRRWQALYRAVRPIFAEAA